MEYQFVLCFIWTSFITISSTYGSVRECADSRNDCNIFSSNCSAAPAFVIKGCPKTCGLCPVNGVNKEFHSVLTISIANQDFQYVNVSCSVYIQSIQNASLIFQCNESSEHLENIGDVNGQLITRSISITVQNHTSLINCTCILKYMSNGRLHNQTITEKLTLRGKSFKPTFYISSSIKSGENITVKVNQTVTFTCKYNSTAKVTLNMYKGREHIISHQILTETIIGKTDGNSSVTHTIKGVQCSDAGEYTCQASGFQGTDKSTVTLSVLCDDDSCKDGGECIQSGSNGANHTPSLQSIPQMDSLNRPFPVTEIVSVLVTVIATSVVLMLVKHFRTSESESRQSIYRVTELSVNGNVGHTYNQRDVILDAYAQESMPVTKDDDYIAVAKGVDIPVAEDGLIPVAEDGDIPVAKDGDIPVAKDGLIYAELDFVDTQAGDSDLPLMPHSSEYTVIDFTNVKMKRKEPK